MDLSDRFEWFDLINAWGENYSLCHWCGEPGANAFHHIVSPNTAGYKKGEFNQSLLNSCPIHNFECHVGNGRLGKEENQSMLLKKTIKALLKRNYEFKEIDVEFYQEYKEMYEE